MDMMDPLTAQLPPARMIFEEEECENENLPSPPPPIFNWSAEAKKRLVDGKLRPKLVILSTSQAGALLLHHMVSSKQVAGSVVLPEVSMYGNAVAPSPSDKSCYMHFVEGSPDALLISCQYEVSGARAGAVVKTLFRHLEPGVVVVLASVAPSAVATGVQQLPGGGAAVYTAHSDAYKALRRARADPPRLPPFLPAGNIIDGLPAAVVSHCQMRGMAASVLLGVQLGPRVDDAEVSALVRALDAELTAVVEEGGLRVLNTAAAADAMKAAEQEWVKSSHAALFA